MAWVLSWEAAQGGGHIWWPDRRHNKDSRTLEHCPQISEGKLAGRWIAEHLVIDYWPRRPKLWQKSTGSWIFFITNKSRLTEIRKTWNINTRPGTVIEIMNCHRLLKIALVQNATRSNKEMDNMKERLGNMVGNWEASHIPTSYFRSREQRY